MTFRVQKLHPRAILPTKASSGSAGYDLSSIENIIIDPGGKALIRTGLKIAIPENTYGRVAPRSGLAVRHGIDVGAGVIDADYRGEVSVLLFNHGKDCYHVHAGSRIAQLILERILTPDVEEVDVLDATERGEGGFGSSGGF